MLQHLFKCNALKWVNSEASSNEIFSIAANLNMLGEGEGTSTNLFVSLFDLL